MLIEDFDMLMRELLLIDSIVNDSAQNGLQVGRPRKKINTVAFSVDASMESFRRSIETGADILFVHHGILWDKPKRIVSNFFNRVEFLIKNDLALYAVHLPLDIHPELGNNIGIAKHLNLKNLEPFGAYKGIKIGFKGTFPEAKTLDEITYMLGGKKEKCPGTLAFGKEKNITAGIVSGGDPKAALQAIDEKLDLFITGDSSHEIYHECLEAGLNVIFGGHYSTETWGIKLVSEKIREITKLNTTLIDIPTGL